MLRSVWGRADCRGQTVRLLPDLVGDMRGDVHQRGIPVRKMRE
ncbi:hypothetical protein FHS67_003834 [Aminobacter aminovorans]|uniref:Uncharacterized protein n=1 Tax=Aminobacter aminovorans TaxID=83263 RepID=A0AAC8YJ92_AMIAI|nr:hypothetical protein AA2016_0418 [Aminobacter aminovorans]MBB3707503.1 hypothetical protein [Aminobacter aminovorans]